MANELDQFLKYQADMQRIPLSISLELTPLCNLNCKMCYIRHTPEQARAKGGLRPPEFWHILIPQLKEAGTFYITLIGGEVFTLPWLEDFYTALIREGFKVSITTNGTMLSAGLPPWLIRWKPRAVTVSLYGMSPQSYQTLCGQASAFHNTMAGIQNLLDAGLNVKLNYCATPINCHEAAQVMAFAQQHNLPISATAYSFPPARKDGHRGEEYLRMSPLQAAECEMELRHCRLGQDYPLFLQQLTTTHSTPCKGPLRFRCRAGHSTGWISWQGRLSACGMLEHPVFDLNVMPFARAWEQLREAIPPIERSPVCASCDRRDVCFACPASAAAETGRIDGTPAYICQMLNEMLRIAGEQL